MRLEHMNGAVSIKYPLIRKRLLELAEKDQRDREPDKFYGENPGRPNQTLMGRVARRDQQRAAELLAFLEQIRSPSVRNIGLDGSRAAWLIAQHKPNYKDLGPLMLRKTKYLYYKDKSQVYYRGIPYLVDRLMIHRKGWRRDAKQLYGTQGYFDEHGGLHGFPIIDPAHLLDRLQKFDLDLRACSEPPNVKEHTR